jgi:hypothetical protein
VPWVAIWGVPPASVKLVAKSVVTDAVLGVVEPRGQGTAQSQPSSWSTFRLATLVVLAMTNGAVPVASVEVICPLKLPVVAANPPVKFGTPEKVGEPVKVPFKAPPPLSVFGPVEVKPELKETLELNVDVEFQVFVPVQMLFEPSREIFWLVTLSTLQIWTPIEFWRTNLYEEAPIQMLVPKGGRPAESKMMGSGLGVRPLESVNVERGVVVPAA